MLRIHREINQRSLQLRIHEGQGKPPAPVQFTRRAKRALPRFEPGKLVEKKPLRPPNHSRNRIHREIKQWWLQLRIHEGRGSFHCLLICSLLVSSSSCSELTLEMGDLRIRRDEAGHARIRNVPIAVTAEGFWCCPSPAVLQKTLKNQTQQYKPKPPPTPSTVPKPSTQKLQNHFAEKNNITSRSKVVSSDQRCSTDASVTYQSTNSGTTTKLNVENPKRKMSIGFGQPETSDLRLVLSGKEGVIVRMNVHRNVLVEHCSFFAEKFSGKSPISFVEIGDCDDIDFYVEIVGLMYCEDMKQKLIKQSVPRVLRILKVAESIGFDACTKLCLGYLEAVPWVEEEEDNVVSSVRCIQNNSDGISPILKRVSLGISNAPSDTLAHIVQLVLKSNEDRGRREMKSLVLKLLREISLLKKGSKDMCTDILYTSCRSCLESLLLLFRQATEPKSDDKSLESKNLVARQIFLEADNILWLVEMMIDRHVADEFTLMWASQDELAKLHDKLPVISRHLVSCITGRLFVGVGRGEILPSKSTRLMLLEVWLQPLIEDYNWLQHSCRSFDQKLVEEGIGRTILTLPSEDQQRILLSWLGSFLRTGDRCPNLQKAFEVWWRRTFIRPFAEQCKIY